MNQNGMKRVKAKQNKNREADSRSTSFIRNSHMEGKKEY